MNLHVLPDSKFSNAFYNNLKEASLLDNNACVIRSNQKSLKHVQAPLPFAKLYSNAFDRITGRLDRYDKVFIHQLHPLMYRWIARNTFKEIHWMVWGTDLYNLPFVDYDFYERQTSRYATTTWRSSDFLYLAKVYLTNMVFKKNAYSKVGALLTWMNSEYQFAKDHLAIDVRHDFFFYENDVPYQKLDRFIKPQRSGRERLRLLLGNSATPTNNHIDAVDQLVKSGINAEVFIPLSYGDAAYIQHIKKHIRSSGNIDIHFIERYMSFDEYAEMLSSMDALIMNNIRPQGYGNIFMMMYLQKPVFMNKKNISLPDLKRLGFSIQTLDEITGFKIEQSGENARVVQQVFSHERLLELYVGLFKA